MGSQQPYTTPEDFLGARLTSGPAVDINCTDSAALGNEIVAVLEAAERAVQNAFELNLVIVPPAELRSLAGEDLVDMFGL